MPSYDISPYKGYWVYLYEEVDINFESKVQIEEDINENLLSTDFIINLSSRSFGQGFSSNQNDDGRKSFGDFIQLGYSLNGSNGFVEGIDIPNLNYQYFNEYTSMYIAHNENNWNSEYNQLTRDIREHYQPEYSWNIVGETNGIIDEVYNPDAEIELF